MIWVLKQCALHSDIVSQTPLCMEPFSSIITLNWFVIPLIIAIWYLIVTHDDFINSERCDSWQYWDVQSRRRSQPNIPDIPWCEWRIRVSSSIQLEGGEFTAEGRGLRLYFCTWSRELIAWWKPMQKVNKQRPSYCVADWEGNSFAVLGGVVCVCSLVPGSFRCGFLLAASLPADLSVLVSLWDCEMAHHGAHSGPHNLSSSLLLFLLSLLPLLHSCFSVPLSLHERFRASCWDPVCLAWIQISRKSDQFFIMCWEHSLFWFLPSQQTILFPVFGAVSAVEVSGTRCGEFVKLLFSLYVG